MRIAIVLKKLRVSLMGFCFDLVQKLKKKKKTLKAMTTAARITQGLETTAWGDWKLLH